MMPNGFFSGHWETPLANRGGTLQPGRAKLYDLYDKRNNLDQAPRIAFAS
jgi:hypothetical protein